MLRALQHASMLSRQSFLQNSCISHALPACLHPASPPNSRHKHAKQNKALLQCQSAPADAVLAAGAAPPVEVTGRVMSSLANHHRVQLDRSPGTQVRVPIAVDRRSLLQEVAPWHSSLPYCSLRQPCAQTTPRIAFICPWHLRLWPPPAAARCQQAESVVQGELLCKVRALMYKRGEDVLVGDVVRVRHIDWRDARGLICAVAPRRTEIRSPKVANVDHFAVVFSAAAPPFEAFQATRFLVAAASVGVRCSLVLNKCDLVSEQERAALLVQIRGWGYDGAAVSVQSGFGMPQVRRPAWLACHGLVVQSDAAQLAHAHVSMSNMWRPSACDYKRSVCTALDQVDAWHEPLVAEHC